MIFNLAELSTEWLLNFLLHCYGGASTTRRFTVTRGYDSNFILLTWPTFHTYDTFRLQKKEKKNLTLYTRILCGLKQNQNMFVHASQFNHTWCLDSRQGIGNYVVFSTNVVDLEVVFLKQQAPSQKPLIVVFHFIDENERVVIGKDGYRKYSCIQVNITMLKGQQ